MAKIIDQKNSVTRPPVVVIMGHIDHGKSSLLDYIRKTNIVAKEAGGITQHVGAYQAEHTTKEGKKSLITFLDTPGHEAFCNIRERGAQAADIAVLIVSAEDGVKPQTIEAYKDIQSAGIPFVVAISKIDKPNSNVDMAKQSLGENEIYVEGWGGDVSCIAISSVTGEGIPELLDIIMLMSELAELKADPSKKGTGVIIESSLDTRKGISATLIIKDGTVSIGTYIVAQNSYTPVRYIEDFKGDKIESAGPSAPIRIIGWNEMPKCGATFITVDSKKEAEKMAEDSLLEIKKSKDKITVTKTDNEEGVSQIVSVPLIIKADVIGSLEGVKHELEKIKHDKVVLNIISEGVGDINENDVKLAQSNPTITIVGFNSFPDKKAATIIERSALPILIQSFSIIYELTNYVKGILEAKIPKEFIEEVTGRAKIIAIFSKEKDRQICGGKVETGMIMSGNEVRIMRREVEIGRGKIRELQEKKIRAKEVAEGHEFGSMVEAKIEIAPGDKIEAVRTIEKIR